MDRLYKYYSNTLGIDLRDLSHPISSIINDIPYSTGLEKRIKKHYLRVLALSFLDIERI